MDDLIRRADMHRIVYDSIEYGRYSECADGSEVTFTSNEVHAMIDKVAAVNANEIKVGH